jgi:putative peptidoglycan lipid II flippase
VELINGGGGDVPSRSLVRPAAVMAVGTALSRLTGLGRVAALSFALGVAESRLADSYNIANTLPNVIYELVLGGVLTSVFIPVLIQELRTRHHEQAWEAASSLVWTSMVILVVMSALTAVLAPWLIHVFTVRVSGAQAVQQQELATFFLRLFAPQVALYGFAAIAGGLLNAHGRFAVPMFAPIVNNLVVIGSLLLFAATASGTPTEGTVGASLPEKLLLGLGTTGGVAAMAAVYWPFLRRLPGRLRRRIAFGHPAVRKLARLSVWTLGYVVVNQIGFGVALYLANGMQGGPTAYFTAFAFFQLPYGIVAVSVMTALVPTLAALHVDADDDGFRSRLVGGLRLTMLILAPATAAYLVLSRPLIRTLLQHGVMRGASSALVASVLNMFAVGLLPFSAFALFTRAFYARQDSRTPMLINLVENAVTIALDFILFPYLGVRGLALAHSLGYLAGASLAGVLLARRIGNLASRATLMMLVRVVAAADLAAAAMVAVLGVIGGAVGSGTQQALVQLLAGGAVGVGVFLAAAWALGVEDLSALRRLLPGS